MIYDHRRRATGWDLYRIVRVYFFNFILSILTGFSFNERPHQKLYSCIIMLCIISRARMLLHDLSIGRTRIVIKFYITYIYAGQKHDFNSRFLCFLNRFFLLFRFVFFFIITRDKLISDFNAFV